MENCIGKICPFCKTEIKEEDDVKVCPVCNTAHHADCWEKIKVAQLSAVLSSIVLHSTLIPPVCVKIAERKFRRDRRSVANVARKSNLIRI